MIISKIKMKNSRKQESHQSKQGHTNVPRPEIRDNLDSRKNEEQFTKGVNVTHNEKETKENHLKRKGIV